MKLKTQLSYKLKKRKKENTAKLLCQWWLTNKRSYSRGEDGAALNDEGHPCSHHDRNVASHPAEGEGEVCSRTERREVSNKPDEGSSEWLHTSHPEQARSFDQKRRLFLSFLCHTTGLVDLETSRKQQGGCTCVAHQASPRGGRCADYQTGCRESFDGKEVLSPVLSTFLMTTATCPFSMELSSLTMRMRQVQRQSRDRARRMRPTATSDRVVLAKMCLPATDGQREDWHLSVGFTLALCDS